MSGTINMQSNRITNLPAPVADEEPLRKVDSPAVSFLSLTDTPASYAAQALKTCRVNAANDAIEFGLIPLAFVEGWTSGKLLKGAGAGVAPTEIIAPEKIVLGPTPIPFVANEMPVAVRVYTTIALTLKKSRASVYMDIAGTNDAEIIIKNAAGTGLGTLYIPKNSVQGYECSKDLSANTIAANSYWQISWWKTTAGGKVLLTVEAEAA